MELSKSLLGQTIIAKPRGNNARGRADDYFEEFKVIEIARKYFTLAKVREDGSLGREVRYCPLTGATESAVRAGYSMNSGYTFFNSKEEFLDYQSKKTLRDEVTKFFNRFTGGVSSFNDEGVKALHAIITDPKYRKD